MKHCTICKQEKPHEAFALRKHGLHSWCRPCAREYGRNHARKNPEKNRARARAARERFRGKVGFKRDELLRHLKKTFGLSPGQWERLLTQSQGRCDICATSFRNVTQEPAVDHCHRTGWIRGLLCTRCNTALERLDNHGRHWAQRALEYLEVML